LIFSDLDLHPIIYANADNANVTFKWQRNCSNELPEGAIINNDDNVSIR